jgi:hypothetical protein
VLNITDYTVRTNLPFSMLEPNRKLPSKLHLRSVAE